MLVIGGVIGSGIFRKPGLMAAQLGSPELLLVVWIVGGIITLFGALTNAEIAAMIPETGGQFIFFQRMYGSFVAFLYGWAAFIVIQTGSISAVAYVFAEYATTFVPLPEAGPALSNWALHLPFIGDVTPFREFGVKLLAVAVIVFLTAVNYAGVKFGGWVQNIFTIAKVGAMLALVAAAFLTPEAGQARHLVQDAAAGTPQGWSLWVALAAALQGAFWAYDGWNKLPYIAGEVRNPQRNLPRALFLGMLFVMGIYVLMNVAYLYVLPIDAMAQSKLVAADVAEKCRPGAGRWIAVAVMLSTFGAANAIILASARVYFSMAQHRVFPNALASVHPRFHTPGAALLAQGIWGVLLLFSGTFDTLTDTLIFVGWIFYLAGAVGIFVLRRKEPHAARPFHVPGYPWVPAIFVLFALLFLTLTVVNDIAVYRAAVAQGRPAMINSAFGVMLVFLGLPVYLFYRRRKGVTEP
jgi:basic amino acid/polyamine antiporter, APA family